MEEFDYYSVMEHRIKYLAKKYDPYNKFPLEWEMKREKLDYHPVKKPMKKNRLSTQINEVYNSVIAFLF